jgi:hypothetical protein
MNEISSDASPFKHFFTAEIAEYEFCLLGALRILGGKFYRSHYKSMPAIDADIIFAIVPASMARIPSFARSPRRFGARAPMPPI